jgi:hypothetical protein
MTLNDLTEQLYSQFPTSVQKDLKTAIRVLAQALNYADPKSCPLEACLQPLPALYQIIETSLISQGKGPHTIRNTKNNLSRLFRLAETQNLFSLVPAMPTRRFKFGGAPKRADGSHSRNDGSHLPRRLWPPEVEVEFAAFSKWATDPFVLGREANWKKRPVTLHHYEGIFQAYFGYLHHKLQIRPVQFSHLFDFTLIESFVYWHINEKWHRPTGTAHNFVTQIYAMASQYHVDPTLRESLKALKKRMPPLRPVYNKSEAWVPLRELEHVGLSLWPEKPPEALRGRTRHSPAGQKYAVRAGASLILRLWVRIPYRQRNMREMKLDQNLYRTSTGQWRIRFANEELKVASKRGQPNVFDLPFPPALIHTLESYLTTWRPILAHIENAPEVFLNSYGHAFAAYNIRRILQGYIYGFTGHYWHPHIMRTIWATEWIQSSGDFMTAAIMLNDRLETVINNYSHLRDENVAETAYQWVQRRMNGHSGVSINGDIF